MEKDLGPLPYSFYCSNTLAVTANLLGKYLVRQKGKKKWIGKIVEAEAYIGENDPACHAFRGHTPRTSVMYGEPGHAYVYFTYGMYFMLNVVTEQPGSPAAVLIRALEPVSGFALDDPRPASGPGKLCKNMEIDKTLNGISFQSKALWIGEAENEVPVKIRWSPRIGINVGVEKIWRAYIFGNRSVSRKSSEQHALYPSPFEGQLLRNR